MFTIGPENPHTFRANVNVRSKTFASCESDANYAHNRVVRPVSDSVTQMISNLWTLTARCMA